MLCESSNCDTLIDQLNEYLLNITYILNLCERFMQQYCTLNNYNIYRALVFLLHFNLRSGSGP